jgi:hypothetical protein
MWWKAAYYLITFLLLAWSLFTPSGRDAWGWFFNNFVAAAIKQAVPLVDELAPTLEVIIKGFIHNIRTFGPTFNGLIAPEIGKLAANNIADATAGLTIGGESTPDNAVDQAAIAFQQAYGFGMSSAAITAAFEALFPEKLNVLNAAGPAFFEMAGFKEVTSRALDPLYEYGFGTALKYHYKSLFKPDFASDADAVKWHSRRLMDEDQLREVFKYSGLKAKYEDAYVRSAYRPVPPFLLARAAEAGAIRDTELTETLEFAGFRDLDIVRLKIAYTALALQPFEHAYLNAAKRSVEIGENTPLHLQNVMNSINLNAEMQNLVQLEVAERKAQELTTLYKKSVSEAYRYGQVTDANYVSSLEAIGIDPAEAEAYYAIDSIAKQGRALILEQTAAARLAQRQQAAAVAAAIEQFRIGAIDEAALEAAMLAVGVDPAIASFAVVVQSARRTGPLVFVYGVELSRGAALQLREKVAALAKQTTAQLITYDQALAELAALGIPSADALALAASWRATTTAPARVGVREPI